MRPLAVSCLLLCSVTALGQMDMGGKFSTMDVEADLLRGNLSGRIDNLTGKVRVTLKSTEPGTDPITIEADKMEFTYADESTSTPLKIVLTGNVHIPTPHPRIESVRSQTAVWSFVSGTVTFSGDVVFSGAAGESTKCPEAQINLETGALEMSGGFEMQDVNFGAMGLSGRGPSDPSLFQSGDVTDWGVLVSAIKGGSEGTEASPGKRVAALLNDELRTYIGNTPSERILENREVLRKELNKLLAKPDLYDEESWKGVALGDDIKALLAMPSRSDIQTTQLNRLLIEAAWPAAFSGAR